MSDLIMSLIDEKDPFLTEVPEYFDFDREIRENGESDSKYSFYIERQAYEVKKMKTNIDIKIPKSLLKNSMEIYLQI